MKRDLPVIRWTFWLAMLGVAAITLLWARSGIDQSHVALTLLLIVLGGSAGGGRPLGYLVALLSFVLIDYYFQPPYQLISVDKPLDWVVLVAFLAAAFVTTELVTRARDEAETARQRSEEVASVARIGAETLRYAEPADALRAIVDLVRSTLDVPRTAIHLVESNGEFASDAVAESGAADPDEFRVINLLGVKAADAKPGDVAALMYDGSVLRGPIGDAGAGRVMSGLAVPLVVEARALGVMMVGCADRPRSFSASDRRFVSALGYYAALGAERLRLAREAEHAQALRLENRAKDEVLATVSHDLRTPLTTIKLLAQNAAGRGDPAGRLIEEQVDRLAELVTNVLDLSRIRAGGVTLELEINAAEDLVGAAISRTSGIARDKRIIPHIDLHEPAVIGRFDFVQSLRILGNLLDNALRYSPPNGVVDVGVRRDGPWIEISVADYGPGIPLAERERIFEPFYRPRTDMPDVGHAGLGLSIARQLAELQGGTVTYAPRLGGGSVFTLRLPAAEVLEPVAAADD